VTREEEQGLWTLALMVGLALAFRAGYRVGKHDLLQALISAQRALHKEQ